MILHKCAVQMVGLRGRKGPTLVSNEVGRSGHDINREKRPQSKKQVAVQEKGSTLQQRSCSFRG